MSDSEDEDYAVYGCPLEPLDEDNLPKKRPILIQDQIATDKHGKRRFHGAFTGGFSAGFFNSVGTLEGWKPSQFKSSRTDKAHAPSQRPEDFMDDEDTDDFGIAPTHLRAKPEYSGSTERKRKYESFEGPIPGVPVLSSILEPARITIGMKLLMRLGWKPGQGIGPMVTWAERVGDIDPLELGVDPDVLFPPTPVKEHCIKAKSDRFGLGYSGLSKEPVLQQRFTLFDDPLKVNEKKKKFSIRGQAFGVGAFENEDEDIYAKEDMSNYDFALETAASMREARKKEREKEKLAICQSFDCIEGFQPAKGTSDKKKYFPPPELPPDFDPNLHRKTRFDAEIKGNPEAVKGTHILDSSDRAIILGEIPHKRDKVIPSINDDKLSVNFPVVSEQMVGGDASFKPFLSDPSKQARYDRYLGFIKIGAADALQNIQPMEMSDWEKKREASEFEQAAKLYRPLSGIMGDRFSRGGLLDDSKGPLPSLAETKTASTETWVIAATEKKFGKLTRFTHEWDPVPLLCKRMNIPEPRPTEATLAKVAEEANKRKPKCSVFDFLDTAKNSELGLDPVEKNHIREEQAANGNVDLNIKKDYKTKTLTLPEPLLDPKIVEAEDLKEKMDLFKAIFASDDEKSDTEEADEKKKSSIDQKGEEAKISNNLKSVNSLRNTSPPRGIFANLDLEALKPKPLPLPSKEVKDNASKPKIDTKQETSEKINPDLLYGPSLPSKPMFIPKSQPQKDTDSSCSSSEEEWIEKDKQKHRKKKHSKKHRKEKKKDRHKQKKKKKR